MATVVSLDGCGGGQTFEGLLVTGAGACAPNGIPVCIIDQFGTRYEPGLDADGNPCLIVPRPTAEDICAVDENDVAYETTIDADGNRCLVIPRAT